MSDESTCIICYDDLNRSNTVLYKVNEQSEWYKSAMCYDCIIQLRSTQFKWYCNEVETTQCAKTAKALIARGPPINLYDRYGFPEAQNAEIYALKYAETNEAISPKLDGSLVGPERDKYYLHLRKFHLPSEED